MSETSIQTICREFIEKACAEPLEWPVRLRHYEVGQVLTLRFKTVWPRMEATGRFRIELFAGGGFAGQVYRCRLESVEGPIELRKAGLRSDGVYAVKILAPASGFARWFRNLVYRIGFQAPFSAQVHESACRAGLLWQKLIRIGAGMEFGRADAVVDVYASFFDNRMGAWGEIREWVEGRQWRLECDPAPHRRLWRGVRPAETATPEYVAKRQFMDRFVRYLHRMGAVELARQYEWWTMKSQPNVLKRDGCDGDASAGLCAVDFRAGLALLPFLPMSPVDVRLIAQGIRRGAWVQFDRGDLRELRRYTDARSQVFGAYRSLVDEIMDLERSYREKMPDLTRSAGRFISDADWRTKLRDSFVDGYLALGLVDESGAAGLRANTDRFAAFYLLGALPIAGDWVRRVWCNEAYRTHMNRMTAEWPYFVRASRSRMLVVLAGWLRQGRVGESRANALVAWPVLYWLQRLTLGFLPAAVHRSVAEPRWAMAQARERLRFIMMFYRDDGFRRAWLVESIEDGYKEGMLNEDERRRALGQTGDVFIARYLKSLAVHFATLPVSEIVYVLLVAAAVVWMFMNHGSWVDARGRIVLWCGVLMVLPISPGSIVRGTYVAWRMVRERNWRDYCVAAPVAFLRGLGYLAFPLQMAAAYPVLSRFMAGRWVTGAMRIVPVFGEKGALFEHMAFDVCFNATRAFGVWARRRAGELLSLWMLVGVTALCMASSRADFDWGGRQGTNWVLSTLVVFILPRVLFYPVLRQRTAKK